MTTFVSMLTWQGEPGPSEDDVRAAIDAGAVELSEAGLHSLVFLSREDGATAAVMITCCADDHDVRRIAASLCLGAAVRVESMPFDEDAAPVWASREDVPPPPGAFLGSVLEAVVSG